MKILLINPPVRESTYVSPPLGLGYIASVARQAGHELRIADCPALEWGGAELQEEIRRFRPDLVGVTAMTPTIAGALEAARLSKQVTKAPVVLGGVHGTLMPEETLERCVEIDYIVRGEGERSFLLLLKAVFEGMDPDKVDGISYRRNGKAVNNPDVALIENLDSIPFPARDLLPKKGYRQHIGHPTSFTTMMTSRGCPYNCIYCTKALYGRQFRFRSPQNIISELREIMKARRVKEIVFYDDNFTVNRERVMELCDLMVREGIKVRWKCEARVDNVDRELLQRMREAGCSVIAYGIESGNEGLLKVINKGVTKAQIREAVKLTKEAGIDILGYFMIGIPGETQETVEETLQFALELDPTYAQFAIATPYPKTELYEMARAKGFLLETDWDRFSYVGDAAGPVIRTEELSQEDLKKALAYMNRRFYFRKRYVLRQMKQSFRPAILKRNISGMKTVLKWTRK